MVTKLNGLDQLKIDPYYKPKNFRTIKDTSIYNFPDARNLDIVKPAI